MRTIHSRSTKKIKKLGQEPASVMSKQLSSQSSPSTYVLALQRTTGNQAVNALLGTEQASDRPSISQPGDSSEREADKMAQEALGAPGGEGEQVRNVSTHAGDGPIAGSQDNVGQPLPMGLRAHFESRFGQDFGGVRIHTNNEAASSARSLNALAYTAGQNIVFDAGQYRPNTPGGAGLLAHELAHVVQQSAAPASGVGAVPTLQRKTKGEEMTDKAGAWLSTTANVKAEVDVLKAALGEIKRGKSVDFNKKAGKDKIDSIGRELSLDPAKVASLQSDWEWFVGNRTASGSAAFVKKEAAFFAAMKSPLTMMGETHPKSQVKYWLKNTPPQVADVIFSVADADLTAEQLYAYSYKEGLDDYVRNDIGIGKKDKRDPSATELTNVSVDNPISGFGIRGLDDFVSDTEARREPITGFNMSTFFERGAVNEKGRVVRSAMFEDMTAAIRGLAAMLKRRRRLFLADAIANGYATPTEDELVYWTYVYFNAGEFAGKAQLEKYKGKRVLYDWIKKGEYANAIALLESYRMLKAMAIF